MNSSNFMSSCLQNQNFGGLDGFQSIESEFSMMSNNINNDYIGAGIIENNYMQQLGYGSMDIASQFSYSSPVTYSSSMPIPTENVDYRWSFPCNDSIKSGVLLGQPYIPMIKDVRKCVNGARHALRNSSSSKGKVMEQIVGNAKKLKMETPVKRSLKLSDKISALQELVSPYGKTDTASVLQEACIYIRIIHQEIRRLSISYLEVRSLQSQFQGCEAERASDLQSRGLCLVPISIMKSLTKESLGDHHHTASRTFRRP